MKIAVIGCGRWGTFHAWYAARIGHDVMLWGRKNSPHLAQLRERGANEFLTLPEDIRLTDDIYEALYFAEIVIVSIHAQALRSFLKELCAQGLLENLLGKRLILCMKGLEINTGKRLTTVVREELGDAVHPVVWVGPGHVQDFVRGIPNCMVIAGKDKEELQNLVEILSIVFIMERIFLAQRLEQQLKMSLVLRPVCLMDFLMEVSKEHSWRVGHGRFPDLYERWAATERQSTGFRILATMRPRYFRSTVIIVVMERLLYVGRLVNSIVLQKGFIQ